MQADAVALRGFDPAIAAQADCESLGVLTKMNYNYYGKALQELWTCRPGQQCRCGYQGTDEANCGIHDNPNFGINHFDNLYARSSLLVQE